MCVCVWLKSEQIIHVCVSAVYETFTVQRSYDLILPGLSKTLEKSSLTAGFCHTPLKTASAAYQPTPRSHNKGAGQAALLSQWLEPVHVGCCVELAMKVTFTETGMCGHPCY